MPSFILRKLEETDWEGFKAQATKESRGLKAVFFRLIALYARVGLDKLEKAGKP